MNDAIASLRAALRTREAVVRVLVLAVFGSAPREPGAGMLVDTAGRLEGTIGGGHLEWKATAIARDLLANESGSAPDALPLVQRFVLGATLGQCCGGAVELLFERWTASERSFLEEAFARSRRVPTWMHSPLVAMPSGAAPTRRLIDAAAPGPTDPDGDGARLFVENSTRQGLRILHERIDPAGPSVWVFGAGHVGAALIATLAPLPMRITWVDSREDAFAGAGKVPTGVETRVAEDPAFEVHTMPAGALALVMTHAHEMDYAICRALLARDDPAWQGLIASDTKAARFRHRLQRQGLPPERIARLTAPIGIEGLHNKHPAAIAIAVAAQVLQVIEARSDRHQRVSRVRTEAFGDQRSRPGDDAGLASRPAT